MQLNNFSVRIPEGPETQSGYVELHHQQQYSILIHNHRDTDCIAQVYVDGKDVGRFHVKAKSNLKLERPENANRKFMFLAVDTDEAKSAESDSVEVDCRGLVQVSFFPLKKGTEKTDIEKMMEELKKHIAESLGHHHIHHYHDYWWPYRFPRCEPVWIYQPTVWGATTDGNDYTTTWASGTAYSHTGDSIGATSPNKVNANCCQTAYLSGPVNPNGIQDNTAQYQAGITGLGDVSDQELPVANIEPEERLYETTISLRLVAVPEQRKTIGALKPIIRGNPIPPPVGT